MLTIRRAEANELPIVLNLLKDAALWLRERQIDYWQAWLDPPPHFVAWIQEGFDTHQFHFACQGQDVVGCFRLQWEDELFWGVQAPAAGYVHSFTTARTLHGKRIGERTLAHIEEMCREHGKQFLRLDCGSHVAGLRRYYEAYGFQRVGEATVMNDHFTLYQKPLDQPSQI